MSTVTNKGRELSLNLCPLIGTTNAIQATCSLIARHATTHHKLSECACNGGYGQDPGMLPEDMCERQMDDIDQRTEMLEKRITQLVESLPDTEDGPMRASFGGDPRGSTVQIIFPESLRHHSHNWTHDGVCVPQR